MAQYGLGNFLYELTVDDGKSKFHFFDPEDADNTADVEVAKKDFPDGISDPDSRQVAELAFSQCSKLLNDSRDDRIRRTAASELSAKHAADARAREAAADFNNNSQELADTTATGSQTKIPADQKAPPHNEPSQDSVDDDSASASDNADDKKAKK